MSGGLLSQYPALLLHTATAVAVTPGDNSAVAPVLSGPLNVPTADEVRSLVLPGEGVAHGGAEDTDSPSAPGGSALHTSPVAFSSGPDSTTSRSSGRVGGGGSGGGGDGGSGGGGSGDGGGCGLEQRNSSGDDRASGTAVAGGGSTDVSGWQGNGGSATATTSIPGLASFGEASLYQICLGVTVLLVIRTYVAV